MATLEAPAQTSVPPVEPVDSDSAPREWSTRAFLGFLGVVTVAYGAVLIYHIARPPGSVAADAGILEQCRQICLKYGLVSSGNVKQDAENFLIAAKSRPLTSGLHELLASTTFVPEATEAHPLLNQRAPDFRLSDEQANQHSLSSLNSDRPVVVVFYLGYGCSHCVAQLLALDKDRHFFSELDATIVAISQDSNEHTAERFREFGAFGFPVLSDADNSVASSWGTFSAAADGVDETRQHGTFVVDRDGKVIWSAVGNEPFLDNQSLLHVIAQSQGLVSAPGAGSELSKSDP